ncbi:MAG: D-alanine--D-alanine ligase [Propionibacteriaceae bacterium]|jgi:D-alanine-D-alanine ligase|nr:D-alanine--D-alanine ligase [Propionibacteriaceae bacterium]
MKNVALIFGGVSGEHEVSCATAGGVFRALDRTRFTPIAIGISKSGRWVRVPDSVIETFRIVDGQLPEIPADNPYPDALLLHEDEGVVVGVRDGQTICDPEPVDVAFALLHGPFGEDGTIQGWFEMLGLPYVGAGVASSAMSMDKDLTKLQLQAAGIPVVPWVKVTPADWQRRRSAIEAEVADLGYPVFVKPSRMGSSVGMTRVKNPEDLADAIAKAQAYDPQVLVEAGLSGAREIEVGVLGGHGFDLPRVSCPGEIVVAGNDGFYDYDAKYRGLDFVTLEVPAKLDPALTERLQEMAAKVFQVMRVEGLARVDFFVVDGEPVVNELNTMPGFTSASLFPQVWGVSGYSYTELISELLDLALERPVGLR